MLFFLMIDQVQQKEFIFLNQKMDLSTLLLSPAIVILFMNMINLVFTQ